MNSNSFAIAFVVLGLLSQLTLSAQTADFSISAENYCAPSLIVIHNNSTQGTGYEYFWDFGKGAVVKSSETTLYETYTDPGNYTITLMLVNGSDTIITSKNVSIFKGPVANLTASPLYGCSPLNVTYTDNSVVGDAAISSYKWDFRNGDSYTGNPAHYTYSSPGTYSIFLEVTDAHGCTSYMELKDLINVYEGPKVGFVPSQTFACQGPLDVLFTNTSTGTGSMNYAWDFGNGQHSTQFNGRTSYTDGTYNVKLVATDQNNCKDSITKNGLISVGSVTGAIYARQDTQIFSQDGASICPGSLIIYSSLPPLTTMRWDITYQNSTHTYNGVQDVNFAVPDSGKLDIRLIYNEASGCGDTLYKSFRIGYVKADFSMDTTFTCQLPLDVKITNLSENASSYKWLLPDSTVSSNTNINYTFREDTSYSQRYTHHLRPHSQSVRLIAENANGCRDTATRNLLIDLLVARFMPDKVRGCVPLNIRLSDSSKSSSPIVSWTYLLDGNTISHTTQDVVPYTFNTPGNYPIRLVIQNDLGCVDTSYQVMIRAGTALHPMFSVSPATVCSTGKLFFTDETPQQNLIDSWQYSSADVFNTGKMNKPDGSVIINAADTGARDIKLSVESNGCVSDTVLKDIFIVEKPTGYFESQFDCSNPYKYSFIAHVDEADSFSWNINGIIYPREDTLKHVFMATGDSLVKLYISDSSTGCSLVWEKVIPVRNVSAYFTVAPVVCKGDPVEFDASGSVDYIDHCYEEGFLWNFMDKTPDRRNYSTDQLHVYKDTGSFSPQLIVTAANGCTDTANATLTVVQPSADFTRDPQSGCGPALDVSFEYTGYHSTNVHWTWLFGDLVADSTGDVTVTHTYNSNIPRVYTATLVVKDMYGCKNISSLPVDLKIPTFDFHTDKSDICLGDPAQFVITSSKVDTFSWNFGDGTTSSTTSSHVYTKEGKYTVGLTVRADGCVASTTRPDYINVEKADASYTLSDSVFTCYPAPVNFTYTGGSSSVRSGYWTFLPGVQSSGYSSSAQYTYTEPGAYATSLTLETAHGCSSTVHHNIVVTGPTASFSFVPNSICSGDTVHFKIKNTSNVGSFQWIFGDGSTSTEANPDHVYTAKGKIIPILRIVQADCDVNISKFPLQVSTINANFKLLPDSLYYCLNNAITARNLSQNYAGSSWSLNGTEVATSTNLNYISPQLGENNLRLIVNNAQGCSDTAEKNFNVKPVPEFSITGDSSICAGNDMATLKVEQQPNWTIHWEPNALITDPGQFTITTSPETNTLITATVTDSNGCEEQQSFPLTVRHGANVLKYPDRDTSIFLGESIQLSVTHANDLKYTWTPGAHISCTDCNDPVVSPTEKTIYKCRVTGGCTDTTLSFAVDVIIDFYLKLPDAFSPNGDGNNDIFLTDHHNIRQIDFRIFNRWGNLMFETKNLNQGWDGKSFGKLQNPDTYAYIIRAVTIHGYVFEKKGTFLLLR